MHANDILDRPDLQYQQERFFRYVNWSGGPTACWPYIGKIGTKGYGQHFIGDKEIAAHRAVWVLANGEMPLLTDDKPTCVLHKCDNPPCCNPSHLFLGSNRDNVDDMIAKNRQAKGENSGRAKLTEDAVVAILGADETSKVLADRFGVAQTTIHNVRLRRTWAHVKAEATPLRPAHGEKARTAKLTDEQVLAIRADTRTHKAIGHEYGVCRRHIGHIKSGRHWKHLLPAAQEA